MEKVFYLTLYNERTLIFRFKASFDEVKNMSDKSHDLGTFWLRKTKKPVLAVLLVRRNDGSLKLYRGTNMEVSMPTGSLCAERYDNDIYDFYTWQPSTAS